MWKPDPRPLPENGPNWPGDEDRVSYRGLSLQPLADLEIWDIQDDRWEVSLTETGDAMMIIVSSRERALSIATRLAEAKDWSATLATPEWVELAYDPLVLRLVAEYPGMIALPVEQDFTEENDLDAIVPYGDDPGDQAALF